MKKHWMPVLIIFIVLFSAGCGSKDSAAEVNTVQVFEDGSISEAIVESFEKSNYNTTELEIRLMEELSRYNAENGEEKIKLKKFDNEDGMIKVSIKYAGAEDYAEFNRVEFFTGTVTSAKEKYPFDREFVKVENGSVTDGAAEVAGNSKVLVLEEPGDVLVSGKILAVTTNVELTGKKRAKVVEQEDHALAYIVYQ